LKVLVQLRCQTVEREELGFSLPEAHPLACRGDFDQNSFHWKELGLKPPRLENKKYVDPKENH